MIRRKRLQSGLACAAVLLLASVARLLAAPPQDYPLDLSAAVSLAQTGPNGTLMSMGCDYQFRGGTRIAQAKYVFVAKNGKGKTAVVKAELEDEGFSGVLVDGWRPDDKPFRGYFAQQIDRSDRPDKPELKPISAETEFPLNPNQ